MNRQIIIIFVIILCEILFYFQFLLLSLQFISLFNYSNFELHIQHLKRNIEKRQTEKEKDKERETQLPA